MKSTIKTLAAIAVVVVIISSCYKEPVDYSKDINDLKALVTELQHRSDSLATALGNTNTNLSNLSKSVDSIKLKLTDIQTQIDALTLSLTTANANIAAINAQLILLNQQYASLLEQLNAILAILNNNIKNLNWSLVSSGDCLNIIEGKLSTDLFLIRRTDVLKSTDGGSTWANTNWPLGIVRSNTSAIGGVAYSSFGNGQLAVAALDNGWYISSDDGASYQATGPTGFGTGAPGMTSLSDGSIISGNGGFLRGIYKTSGIDNLTWSQKFGGVDIYDFAKVNDDTLFSCGGGPQPLLRSDDRGETWTPVIQSQNIIDYIAIHNDSILVTNRDGNITVSSRFNFNSSTTPKYAIAGSADFKKGIYSKSDNLLIISASYTGFYISNDFGNTFKLYTIPSATEYNNPAVIGNNIYINTNVGLYSSKFK